MTAGRMARNKKYGDAYLERKVSLVFEDAIFDDRISTDDMEYWFEPGKAEASEYLEYLPVVDDVDPFCTAMNEDVTGRTPTADLQVGTRVTGRVVEVSMFHGLMIDVGAEHNVLVPVDASGWDKWTDVTAQLDVGEAVVDVDLTHSFDPSRHRFPLVGRAVAPSVLASMVGNVEAYESAITMRPGDSVTELAKEVGREYNPPKYYMEFEEEPVVFQELEDEVMERSTEDPAERLLQDVIQDLNKSMGR